MFATEPVTDSSAVTVSRAPTPADTYAVIAARQRAQAIDAAKAEVTRLARQRGYHHPDTDTALARLGALLKED